MKNSNEFKYVVALQNCEISSNDTLAFLKLNPLAKRNYEREKLVTAIQNATFFVTEEEACMYAFALNYKLDRDYSWDKYKIYWALPVNTKYIPELIEEEVEQEESSVSEPSADTETV